MPRDEEPLEYPWNEDRSAQTDEVTMEFDQDGDDKEFMEMIKVLYAPKE